MEGELVWLKEWEEILLFLLKNKLLNSAYSKEFSQEKIKKTQRGVNLLISTFKLCSMSSVKFWK